MIILKPHKQLKILGNAKNSLDFNFPEFGGIKLSLLVPDTYPLYFHIFLCKADNAYITIYPAAVHSSGAKDKNIILLYRIVLYTSCNNAKS